MHKNLVKIARMVLDISLRTDRHTDVLITVLRHRSRVEVTTRFNFFSIALQCYRPTRIHNSYTFGRWQDCYLWSWDAIL